MADPKTPQASATPTAKSAKAEDAVVMDSNLQTFYLEDAEDRKTTRWAFGLAILFHVILLFIHLPEMAQSEPPPPEKKKVYVVQQVRFKPPPPKQKQELPKPKKKKVPIPDPTPDEPEPIREPEEIEPEIDLPDTDVIFDIPEGPPPSEPTGPVMVGGDVKAPVKVTAPKPNYTELARKARITGIVIVQATVDKQGNVVDAKVLKGLPMGLDQEALNAIKRWKFEPATLNGKPVDVYYNLTVNFTLQ
jgi:periplasmic protein TonB